MKYTPEEKLRMDRLMAAFRPYVENHRDIDVAYTDKSGYLRIVIAECADWCYFPIESFDDMLRMFFFDVFNDWTDYIQEEDECGEITVDIVVPYNYLRKVLSTLEEDREYALEELRKFPEHWRRSMREK